MTRRDSNVARDGGTSLVAAVLFWAALWSDGCSRIVPRQDAAGEAGSVVAIGLEFADAERILAGHGARKAELAVAPMRSADGTDQKLDCYSLPDERAICLTHQVLDGRDQIVDLEVYRDMDKPQSQRTTEKVKEIDLRRP